MSSAIKSTRPDGVAQKRALLAERLRKAAREPREAPLSFAQQRLWFLDQLEPQSPLYNIGAVAQVDGVMDVNFLRQALDQLVARHETLRTRFACPDGAPVQLIDPHAEFNLTPIDLSQRPEPERLIEAERLIRAELARPFVLTTDHPMRASLIRLSPRDHRLVLILHHIVADEWSLKVLFRELSMLYSGLAAGQPVKLAELPIQYADYARWQRVWLQGENLRQQLDYWKRQLKDYPPLTQLPTDHPRGAIPTFNGATVTRTWNRDLAEDLKRLAQRHEATPFMVLLAAFKALLHRYTQQADLIVGSPVAGRTRVETESLVGFFVNTLALRTSLAGDPTFEELLGRVREATLGAMAHQELPFERLVEELQPERSLTHLPFTRLMFVYQSGGAEPIQLPGATLRFIDTDNGLAKFDVTVVLRETGEGLLAKLEYNRDLFEAGTMERLLGHWETMLRGIAAAPGKRLSQLPLFTPAELTRVLTEWNQTSRDYPRELCVHQVFEAQAQRVPEATAIVWGQQRLSYGELNARANQLAGFLKTFGIQPEAPIGLCVERSLEMVVGMLGILKAGGAYVPLDASYPKDRLAFMLQDTQAPVVLTQQHLLGRLPLSAAKLVCLDADWELIAREPRQNAPNLAHPQDLAYIMYTSGSTGQPKGVAVPHRAICRLVLNTNFIQWDASDRIAQVSNISFDAATFELWGALLNGAQVVGITKDVALSPKEFARELREQRITAMFLTAALFNQLASEAPGAFESLRTLIAGGEALDPKWVRSVLGHRPPQRLVNGYGPTENTTFTCCHLIHELGPQAVSVPIGRPINNTTVYILDPQLNPVPVGVPGELYTGGDGLARGYWNRPELTEERFIRNPFDPTGSSRLYRTGDLARYLPDGTIECLRRIDGQVKLRGYRIELGEIETQLGRHPAVRQCVVAVQGRSSSSKRLVAYLVPAGESMPNASELRTFLVQTLPDYMVPSAFVRLARLPLTPNGKVDRQALPAPDQTRPSLDRQYVAPRDDTERVLADIWESVLGVRPVGVQDKFFDLGGHSMLAVRVIAQIEKAFGKKLRLATIFQTPTVERLAAVLREEIKESHVAAGTSVVEIQGAGTRPPLFLVHGAGGGMFWGYVNLARCLGADQPVYGFKARGLDGHPEFERIEEMAAQYIADLRTIQPRGPYYLGGYCFGGNVAYEMACQLADQAETVALVALLNCAPPHSRYAAIPWSPRWALRFARNLLYWANYFCHWNTNQRREFFRWKGELLKKRFVRLFRAGPSELVPVEPGDLVDLSSYTEEQKAVWETHIRALLCFHPRPYKGRVHLFRSPGHPLWCSFDEDYGWGDLALGGVTAITIPGVHEKILEEPWVKKLAGQLGLALSQTTALSAPSIGSDQNGAASTLPVPKEEPSEIVAPAPQRAGEVSYPELLARRLGPHRGRVAIRFHEQEMTYAELERRSNQLGNYLQARGVGPEDLVAVALERSLDLGPSLLGILKAGGAYLPLDPEYPAERLAFMVQDARPKVLLTATALLGRLPAGCPQVICLDDPRQQSLLEQCSAQAPPGRAAPDNLAYVIYTSGSTGVPKGVQITHRALVNHNLAILEAYGLCLADRVLQFTPLSFDISVEEIFPTWLAGASLVLRTEGAICSPEDFLRLVSTEQVSVLNLPTAYWHECVEFLWGTGARLPASVRLVVVGGEAPARQTYERWKQCVPEQVTLVNGYGATEATITTTVYRARYGEETLPIGQALANTATVILDERLQPVPGGTPGELYIGGAGLARGYLNRPELTARAFIKNPVPSLIASERLYKTGDRVRARADGNLEFIGRLDDQVKIRGFRIELGEIEAALRAHPAVKDAAVIAREAGLAGKRLVGYYVYRNAPGPAPGELHGWLKRKLPAYMLPAVLVPLPQLPLNSAGKIDRQALPTPGKARPELAQAFVPAANPTEERLAKIWSEVLELEKVGVNDDFIELGGHSLLAIKVLSRLREAFGVELSLADFFARPTIAALAGHLFRLKGMTPADRGALSAEAVRVPLSPQQERIWFLDQLDPKRTAYNRAVGVHLAGKLDGTALRHSLSALLRRQDALRAVFPADHGEPEQLLVPQAQMPLPVRDLSGFPEPERESQALRWVTDEASRPYIRSGPVLRALLLRLSDVEHWLVLIVNEIAVDESSLWLILQELPRLYEAAVAGQSLSPAPLSPSYSEAVGLVPGLSAEQENRQLDYWKRRLGDAPELLDLPTDRTRPVQGDYAGARHSVSLDAAVVGALDQLAGEQGCEPVAVLLAAFAALLQRYTGSADIVVGSVASLRQPATRDLVGPFENRVAWRCDLSGDPTFRKLVERCALTVREALANSSVPFQKVIAAACPQISPSYTPIFQVFLSVEPEPLPRGSAGGLHFAPFEIDTQTSRFDLSLKLVREGGEYRGRFKYSTALFDEPRLARLAEHFRVLLRHATAQPDQPLSKLELLPEHEARQLLVEWNATAKAYPADKTLPGLFREQVLRAPYAEALVCGNIRLTYAELYQHALAIAARLKDLDVTRDSLVGICLERSAEMVAAMLGTLLAGAAYVPLDPKYPAERLAFTLADAAVKVLVTQSHLQDRLPAGGSPVLCLDSLEKLAGQKPADGIEAGAQPGDLAYVIYTSGSTGKPKGVALEHRNAVAFVSWAQDTFSPEELSGVLAGTSICFDLSVFELFVPLCSGGKVILAENALALKTLPAAAEVRLINTVPSAIRELLRLQAVPSGVQVVNLAGEPLSTELVDQIYRQTSVRKVYDLYGPTETTTYSTGGVRRAGVAATIGKPLSNEEVYLLDSCLRPVPIGVPGELFIGGAGVARGYLNRPELTAQKFIAHPLKAGARLYRTGDLARWCADGTLEYLGRLDHQVKIRGFRIELGEVEAALKAHPGVQAALVMAREDHPGDKRLVGYVVPRPDAVLAPEALKEHLRQHLPEFMVPAAFVSLAALPMTPNGKLDRKALPPPEPPARERANLVEPRTAVEKQLAAIWQEVLQVKQLSVTDNFFDLGGHSLLAVRIISAIRDNFQLELPLSALFSSATVAGLAQVLSAATSANSPVAAPPISPIPRTAELPVSFVQERLWFLDQLDPGSAAYNVPIALRLKGPLDPEALRRALVELGARHEALRSTFKYNENRLSQVPLQKLSLELPCLTVESGPDKTREQSLQESVSRAAREPFDLSNGPLVRGRLFRLEQNEHVLLLVLHHAISDGWSLALLLQELAVVYDHLLSARAPRPLEPLPIQYADFAHWQRHWMSGPVLEREMAHWKTALQGAPAELDLPLDHPRPERAGGRAASLAATLESAAAEQLVEFGRREGCTPFMVFLAALALTLRQWTGQRDMILGTVVAGRTRRELENLIGCFMNFLPLRVRVQDVDSGIEVLRRVRATVLDAQSHQDCPFEKIVEAANPQRRANQNPLYNVGLLLQNFPENLFVSPQLQASSYPVSLEAALLDLRFEILAIPQGFSLVCEFRTELFEPATIQALLGSWSNVIQTLVRAPESRLPDFEILAALAPKTKAAEAAEPAPTLAIAATFTAEPVSESLHYWLRHTELEAALEFAPYNQVFQQLLDPGSLLATNPRGLNVILARLEDWLPAEPANTSAKPDQLLLRSAAEFVAALKTAAGRSAVPFLVCLCPPSAAFLARLGGLEIFSAAQHQLEEELSQLPGVYLLSAEELNRWYPVADYEDPASDELGRVPYTPVFFASLGTALARKFHALNRSPVKVIALDCDNTLWSGVCGEEGPLGIEVDTVRRELQEFMRAQRGRGMLLCLCSKNNTVDVEAVFSQRAEMPLRLSDFAAVRLNWQPKSANLKSLAAELGLGLDSFIFVDDNPVECAEVAAHCPEVLALQLPENASHIPQFLNHCWAFDQLKVTTEDRQRAARYDQNRQREKLRAEAPDLKQFLAGLELKVQIQPLASGDWPRVSQLTQRTNQFNFTTRRLSEQDLAGRPASAAGLSIRVSDRFGDYGLVGAVLYQLSGDTLAVDTLLLSCRVLGRGVEHRLLSHLAQIAAEKSVRWLDLHFVPTARNKPALEFLEQVAGAYRQPLNGGSVYRLPVEVAAAVTFPPPAQPPSPIAGGWGPEQAPQPPNRLRPAAGRRFSRCRQIALETHDAPTILQNIRARTAMRQRVREKYVAPGTELERRLCGLWEELLRLQPVGVQDDFFELGGHSLLAVRLFAEIQKMVGRRLPLVTLFQAPTIAQLAQVLSRNEGADSLLVPIQPNGGKPPLFLVHGAGGDVLWGYANLAAHLPPDQPLFGIKSAQQETGDRRVELEEMARGYLAAIRARQPQGPYYLGGYCFGGNVAYEMARQLQIQGQAVALVVLIDTAPANAGYETVPWWRPGFAWRFALNLRYWLADFVTLEAEDRRRFFLRKLRCLARKLERRLGLGKAQPGFDLEEVIDLRHFPERELKLWQAHLEALVAHVERPYTGSVALIRTRGQTLFCSLEEDFCWGKLVSGGVVVRRVPGSHENIFMEPNVRTLAAELTQLLQPSQSGAASLLHQPPVSCL